MDIEKLLQEERYLRDLLRENLNNQKVLNAKAFTKKYGVNMGDAVEWIDGTGITPRKGVVSEIEFSGTVPYRYIATLFNSDGKLGKREVRIWSCNMNTVKVISKA